MKRILLLILFTGALCAGYAQRTITGMVTDEKGESMPGVTVFLKGNRQGAISDIDGKYTIKIPEKGAVVQFSFIGYQTESIDVKSQREINVKLLSKETALDEVVVIGYGTARKKDLTGSVAQVRTEELEKANVKSLEEALGGRVAGVRVVSSEGKPGAEVDIVIRGGNSITQSNAPLYVIDGFAIEDPDPSMLDPVDITSMDILKDASATAIYGSRGANGVIVINTKRGQVQKPRVSYSGYAGIQTPGKQMEVLQPYDFVRLMIEIDAERGNRFLTDGRTLDAYRNVEGVNWQDKLCQDGIIHSHNVSMNGGSKDTKYSVSLGYFNQQGVLIASGFERLSGKLSIDQRINKQVEVGINASYTQSNTNGVMTSQGSVNDASSYLLYNAWAYAPVSTNNSFDMENEDIDPDIDANRDYRFNPIKTATNEYVWKRQSNMTGNLYINYEILKGLTLRLTGGIYKIDAKNEAFFNSNTRQGKLGSLKSYGSIRMDETLRSSTENTLTYKTQKNGFNIETMGGISLLSSSFTRKGHLSVNVMEESLGINGLSTGTPKSIYSEAREWSLMSYFGRIFVGYRDRYLLTATFRADGSSKFTPRNRWGYFPSASLAWRISEESFLKQYPEISQIKLRASWGLTGNNRVGEYDVYTRLSSGYYPVAPESGAPAPDTRPDNLANTNLRWETTEQWDTGIDLAFFNSRLSVTFDYYNKLTRDLLLSADMPPSSTFVTAMKNVGSVSNQGIELTIGGQLIKTRKFLWSSEFNISLNRSKVLALNAGQPYMHRYINWDTGYKDLPAYTIAVGQPLGQMFGYVWDGVYQIDDFTWQNNSDASISHDERAYVIKPSVPYFDKGTRPGDIKYKNIGGDPNVIDDNDRTVIGCAEPDFIGGWNNVFNIGDFDVTLFMQFSVGGDILNANRLYMERMMMNYTNQFTTVLDRWSPENPSNKMFSSKGMRNYNYSSRVIEDGSFLRLKNLTVGYTIPKKLTQKINIYKVRLYLSGQNLFTLNRYSGLDPEVSTRGNSITPSFDFSAYPRSTNFLLGLNVTF